MPERPRPKPGPPHQGSKANPQKSATWFQDGSPPEQGFRSPRPTLASSDTSPSPGGRQQAPSWKATLMGSHRKVGVPKALVGAKPARVGLSPRGVPRSKANERTPQAGERPSSRLFVARWQDDEGSPPEQGPPQKRTPSRREAFLSKDRLKTDPKQEGEPSKRRRRESPPPRNSPVPEDGTAPDPTPGPPPKGEARSRLSSLMTDGFQRKAGSRGRLPKKTTARKSPWEENRSDVNARR